MTPEEIEKLIISEIKRFGGKIPKGTKFYWAKLIKEYAEGKDEKNETYNQLSEQWKEDKRLGILDKP